MSLYRSPAFILRCFPWLEADKLVLLFTRNFGKVKGIASGAYRTKNRFGGSLETLTLVHIIYFFKEGQELVRINSCDIIRPFLTIKEDFERLKRALYASELNDLVLPLGEPNPKLFDALYRFLSALEKVDEMDGLLRSFELQVLKLVGLAPQMNCCVTCDGSVGEKGFYFNPRLGGLICSRCLPQAPGTLRISPKAVNFMRRSLTHRLYLPKPGEPSGYPFGEIRQILQKYIQIHLEREPRSSKMMEL